MEYVIASFIILVITVCLYYIGGIRRLRLLGIVLGSILLLLHLLSKEELASTPANYTLHSNESKSLASYFIRFYPEMESNVIECEWGASNTLRSPGFETEGASEIWIVTTHKNNSIAALNKIVDGKSEAKVFIIGEKTHIGISKQDRERAINLIASYKIERCTTIVLLILNALFVLLLLVKRNKGSKT